MMACTLDCGPDGCPVRRFVGVARNHPLPDARPVDVLPEAGFWCIGEAGEHLLPAEIGPSKMVQKPMCGDYHGQTVPASATLYTVDLDQYPYGRLQVPRSLVAGSVRD